MTLKKPFNKENIKIDLTVAIFQLQSKLAVLDAQNDLGDQVSYLKEIMSAAGHLWNNINYMKERLDTSGWLTRVAKLKCEAILPLAACSHPAVYKQYQTKFTEKLVRRDQVEHFSIWQDEERKIARLIAPAGTLGIITVANVTKEGLELTLAIPNPITGAAGKLGCLRLTPKDISFKVTSEEIASVNTGRIDIAARRVKDNLRVIQVLEEGKKV